MIKLCFHSIFDLIIKWHCHYGILIPIHKILLKFAFYTFRVYIEDVEKDAKALKASKQAQTKKCLERIHVVQKDLQESISEVKKLTGFKNILIQRFFMFQILASRRC